MKDPYEVLGVPQTATDKEIKKAYHELVKKYHPDNYTDNPLADLASEKLKQINEAYDTITRQRAVGADPGYTPGSGSSYGSSSYSGSSSYGDYGYSQVRSYISSGRLDQAESMLNGMNTKDGEWYYLRGVIAYRRGWMDEARQNFQIANNMMPSNVEYQNALRSVQGAYTPYRSANYGNTAQDNMCDLCTMMMCMNCLCGGCGR